MGWRNRAGWSAAALLLALPWACEPDDTTSSLIGPTNAATTGSGGSGQGGSGTGGFVDPNCEEQPCKLVAPQCGCPDGERCTLANSERVCVPDGDKLVTEACGECTAGLSCVDNGAGGPPLCHAYCNTDEDCPGDGGRCILQIDNGLASLCTHDCDPVGLTGCADAATKCDLFLDAVAGWHTLCGGAGNGLLGQPCTVTQDCAAGLGCFLDPNTNTNLCLPWCEVNNSACEAGTTCEPFAEPVLVGAIEYGVCL